MKKVIVTTTINPPTEAIEAFQAMTDWDLVVIGDKKTPSDYHLSRGVYVTPEEQEKYDPALSDAIGWNCIQRRSFGLLWANDMKADVVAVVDDDNIPLPGWGKDLLVGKSAKSIITRPNCRLLTLSGATNHAICGIGVIRCSCSPTALTIEKAAGKSGWTCRPISGMATRTSMRFAAWNMRRNAILIRAGSRWRPTKWGRSIRKTLFCAARC